MSVYFLDSSALLKRYVPEIGTNWVLSLSAANSGHSIMIAHVTVAEVVSGIMRRKREGSIPIADATFIRILLDQHAQQEYNVLVLTSQILQRAEDLLENHPLRAYDSIQLASALEGNQRLTQNGQPPLIFLSSDQRLLTVASAEGLAIDDPNAHP